MSQRPRTGDARPTSLLRAGGVKRHWIVLAAYRYRAEADE
jgi:hypothetical protein